MENGVRRSTHWELQCCLDKQAWCPGETLSGRVTLRLTGALDFVALRVHVQGVETSDTPRNYDCARQAVSYRDVWITLSGSPRHATHPTLHTYDAGTYVFPFAMKVPLQSPPTYVISTANATLRMAYTATATLEWEPYHKEVRATTPFVVVSAASERQFNNLIAGGHSFTQTARISHKSWLHRPYGVSETSCAHTTVRMEPGLVALQELKRQQLCARVTVRNDGATVLKDIEVIVCNRVRVVSGRTAETRLFTVGSGYVRKCRIQPKEKREVIVPITLRPSLRFRTGLTAETDNDNDPLPSFVSDKTTSTYVVEVRFPRNGTSTGSGHAGLVEFTEEVARAPRMPTVPVTFGARSGAVEDLPYVVEPADIDFFEEDGSVYPAVHLPYLPRTDVHHRDDGNGGEEEAERGAAGEGQPMEAFVGGSERRRITTGEGSGGPVLATVVPGRVVCATVLEMC